MNSAEQTAVVITAESRFNYNKLQAALCIAASAAVSIGLTWYAVRQLFS